MLQKIGWPAQGRDAARPRRIDGKSHKEDRLGGSVYTRSDKIATSLYIMAGLPTN